MSRTRFAWARRLAAGLALAPAALAAAGWAYQRLETRRDGRRYPSRGLLLAREPGRYLHVVKAGGRGTPSVVFEAGLAASSLSWSRVQPRVGATTGTASYDRAGLGWSSRAGARSTAGGSAELDRLVADLDAVAEWTSRDPVVLAAHSFGALIALAYVRRFPERVAGLVLVEPVSLSAWSSCGSADRERLETGARLSRRGAWLAEFGLVRAALALLLHGGGRWSRSIGRRAAGQGSPTLERLTGEVSGLPAECWPEIAAQWSRPQSFRTMAAALEELPGCAAAAAAPCLPEELPVAILSAATASAAELRERDGWLAGVIERQHLVVPDTGHWLHVAQPEAVAESVRWVVERARRRS